MNKMISNIDFKKEAIEGKGLSLVQFNSECNGACQIITGICDELASSYKGMANFYIMNWDEDDSIGREYGVREVPTILFIREGKVIDHIIGLTLKHEMTGKN